ncbi:MAG: galactokinase [Opitutaceae bacterium]|jgi:galactokinase|nr:galactokinase [Opitutaceae bacterium]
MHSKLTALFQKVYGRPPEIVTRAPGRIEFIGNHTDYNGGTVLGAAIDRGVWVGLARREDDRRQFYSELAGVVTTLPSGVLARQEGSSSWINYPLGVLAALPAFDLPAPEGFDYLAISDLPAGAGLSSSAAIELASALAFLTAVGSNPDRETVVKLGRHAENHFVGVPCGILDQGVSGFGQRDHLVFIDCRGPRFETVPLPRAAHFWVFNTHTKHALVDGLYASRHRECMEAARALGVGQLVEATMPKLERARAGLSDESYKRARHVIEEIARVDNARQALRRGDLSTTGRLLTASHRSSQVYFENSTPELDFLVDLLAGGLNVFGARLTGGGFGGAVMALTTPAFGGAQAAAVADAYAERFGKRPDILHAQTGPGAQVVMK